MEADSPQIFGRGAFQSWAMKTSKIIRQNCQSKQAGGLPPASSAAPELLRNITTEQIYQVLVVVWKQNHHKIRVCLVGAFQSWAMKTSKIIRENSDSKQAGGRMNKYTLLYIY